MLGGVGGRLDSHGSAGGPKEDTVDTSGRPGAGPSPGQLRQHFAVLIGVLRPGCSGACGVKSIFMQYELEVPAFFLPEELSILRAGDNQPASLGSGEKNTVVITLDKRRRRIPRDIMLRPAIRAYRVEQVGI